MVLKGAWLTSKDEISVPSYHGHGRAVKESLTESLGLTGAEEPVNFSLPYIDQYLVTSNSSTAAQ